MISNDEILKKEAEFHDLIAEKIEVNYKMANEHLEYDSPASYIADRLPRLKKTLIKKIGNPEGKRVLVYGCGNDSAAVWFSKMGARVDAIDISSKSVKNQVKIANLLNLKINCIVMDANNLDLPFNEYDIVYGNAILHHLDIKKSIEQIIKVLKPGGRAIFRDVMKGNIFLQFFRYLTPFWRTEDEHPLTSKDFILFNQKFKSCTLNSYILTGLPYFFLARILNNVFFKKIGSQIRIPIKNSIYAKFDKLDEKIFTYFPFFKNKAWLCLVILSK